MSSEYSAGNDGHAVLEAQAQAFSDLGRTLTEAVEQARQQAFEIVGRAQEHANVVVTRADRRVAEGLRQATGAERRAVAAQTRLVGLETRIEQAQSKLTEIGAQANEITRLVTTIEVLPAVTQPFVSSWDQQHLKEEDSLHRHDVHDGDDSRHQHDVHDDEDIDALAALASLRDTVDATG